MFTGIVTDIGEVIAIAPRAERLRRLTIACRYDRAGIADGASIACNGVSSRWLPPASRPAAPGLRRTPPPRR